ncbi:hypothetical protein HY251_17220, partial [bacterium]|nr:hypothetical protein [bacterium]
MRARLALAVSLGVASLASVGVPARGDDREKLALDKWETARAPRDGAPVGKLAAGAPRLPFAAAQEDVLARTVVDVPAAVASCTLALELERVRWDATLSLDGSVLASGLEGDVSVDLPPLSPGKHEILLRARDVRAAAVAGKRVADDDSVEGGWFLPVGKAPRLAGILGSARIVERLQVDVVSTYVESIPGRKPELVLELRGRTGEPCLVRCATYNVGSTKPEEVALAKGERGRVVFSWPEEIRSGTPLSHMETRVLVNDRIACEGLRLSARSIALENGRLAIDGKPAPFFVLGAPPGEGKPAAQEAIRRARAAGATVVATGGFRDRAWLDAVELSGLLILMETDLAPPLSAYALEDERFWRAFRRDALAMIERERGRSAIVAWGLARGLLRDGAGASAIVREKISALGREARALDASRPVALPQDDARLLGFGIAWEPPHPRPERARGAVVELPPADPPLTLASRVSLAGDPGFLDANAVALALARERAGLALEARALSALGVDLGAPPEAALPELARSLAPLVLVPEPARGGGELSGKPVERRLTLVSDLPAEADVAITWSLTFPGQKDAVLSGRLALRARLGAALPLDLRFTAPPVKARQEASLHVEAVAQGERAALDLALALWPARAQALRTAKRVVLVDGHDGSTGEALVEAGVSWREAPAS